MEPVRPLYARLTFFAIAFVLGQATATALHPNPALAVEVTRGPYLQLATATSMTIRWRTDVAVPSRVLHGIAPGGLTDLVGNDPRTTEHEVTITGLSPDERRYYAIASDTEVLAGADFEHWFTTAPPAGSRRPIRLWVLGDSGTADDDAAAVRDAFVAFTRGRSPDVWLMLGDNAYSEGSDDEYQEAVFDMFPDQLRNTVLWPSRGNHDESEEDYYGIFTLPSAGEAGGVPSGTEAYYSFDHGNLHVVCIDSEGSDRSADGDMAKWLRNDLASHSGDWSIAYFHHPPYSKGSHDSDDEDHLQDMRENIVPILEAGRVDLVLAGHSHSYERSCLLRGHFGESGSLEPSMRLDAGNGREGGDGPYRKLMPGRFVNDGTVYVVAGCSGRSSGGDLDHPAMVVGLDVLGSLVIDITGLRLDGRFIDDEGTVLDEFTILKSAKLSMKPSVRDRGPRILLSGSNPSPHAAPIQYSLPAAGRVRLSIFSVDGRRVVRLRDEQQPAGDHRIDWDGRNSEGGRVPAGLYFAELRWDDAREVARIVMLD